VKDPGFGRPVGGRGGKKNTILIRYGREWQVQSEKTGGKKGVWVNSAIEREGYECARQKKKPSLGE